MRKEEKEEQKSYKSSRPRKPRKRKSGMGGSRNRPISRVPRVREGPEDWRTACVGYSYMRE